MVSRAGMVNKAGINKAGTEAHKEDMVSSKGAMANNNQVAMEGTIQEDLRNVELLKDLLLARILSASFINLFGHQPSHEPKALAVVHYRR